MKQVLLTVLALMALVVLAVVAFGGSHPGSSQETLPGYTFFAQEVLPLAAVSCSSRAKEGSLQCHGLIYGADSPAPSSPLSSATQMLSTRFAVPACARACHESPGGKKTIFMVREGVNISDQEQVARIYEHFLLWLDLEAGAEFSPLLRKPLAASQGGLPHDGGDLFDHPGHPGYRLLHQWATMELSVRGRRPAAPSPAEAFFRDQVLPVFANNSCMLPSCHTFNHTSFLPDAGIPVEDTKAQMTARFSPEMVRQNRRTALGSIQMLAWLTGDVTQSRILKKSLPLHHGGTLHRGGNDQFLEGPEDPDFKILRQWLTLERQEAVSRVRSEGSPVAEAQLGRLRGMVFLRLPTALHRHYLDVGKYLPGGDLYLLKLREGETLETATGKPVNLTARFHPDGPADIREPTLRFDGRSLVFAMRRGQGDNLNLYEILLDKDLDYVKGSFRRLTWGPREVNGIRVHYTDPLFVPDSYDEEAARGGRNLDRADLVFAANLEGRLAPSSARGTLGEVYQGDRQTIIDPSRPEPSGTFTGRRIYFVDGTNQGEWRTIIAFENRLFGPEGTSILRLDRPLPRPVDRTTRYVIEPSGPPRYLPGYNVYGIRYPAPGQEEETFRRTLNRITWGLGQEMDLSLRSTGEVFYGSLRSAGDLRNRPVFNFSSSRLHLDSGFSFPTHHGNRAEELIYADSHEMPDGTDIHAGLHPDTLWEGGNLIISDHQFGPGLEPRNPVDYASGTFDIDGYPTGKGTPPSHPRTIFKKSEIFPLRGPDAVTREGLSPRGIFRDPVPLPDGRILVSHAPGPLRHDDPKAGPDFDLYILAGDPALQRESGRGHPSVRLKRLSAVSSSGMSEVQAVPIHVRLKPKIRAGARPEGERLIRDQGAAQDRRPARYFERNYLLIDAIQYDPTPTGKHVAYERSPVTGEVLPEEQRVRYVRLVEGLPLRAEDVVGMNPARVPGGDPMATRISAGIHPVRRILAEIPVEEDGSILARVPSRTPFIFQSLNKDRMALRTTNRWFFFVANQNFSLTPPKGETFQQCAACMGGMGGQPRNVYGAIRHVPGLGRVAVDDYPDVPDFDLAPSSRFSVDFRRDVTPILEAHCTPCHGGAKPAAGLPLTSEPTAYYNTAYESLLALEEPKSGWYGRRRYVSERNGLAIESYLIAKLYGRPLQAPRPLSGDHPHPSPELFRRAGLKPAPLNETQRLLLVRWIDLGAAFKGAGKEAKP